MNVREILKDAKEQLALSEIDSVDAEILLAHVLGISRMDLHNPLTVENALSAIPNTTPTRPARGSGAREGAPHALRIASNRQGFSPCPAPDFPPRDSR